MTNKERLIDHLFKIEAVRRGDFTLTSGKKSDIYIDARKAALTPYGIELIVHEMAYALMDHLFDSIGCMEGAGSNVILGGLLMHGPEVPGFIVRKESKQHGLQNIIEGSIGKNPILIDDVATSGKSLVHAIKSMPVRPQFALVVLDRQEGAAEALQPYNVPLRSIITMDDLRAFK